MRVGMPLRETEEPSRRRALTCDFLWWRGEDLNLRPSGYEPDELPDCSTPRRSPQNSSRPKDRFQAYLPDVVPLI